MPRFRNVKLSIVCPPHIGHPPVVFSRSFTPPLLPTALYLHFSIDSNIAFHTDYSSCIHHTNLLTLSSPNCLQSDTIYHIAIDIILLVPLTIFALCIRSFVFFYSMIMPSFTFLHPTTSFISLRPILPSYKAPTSFVGVRSRAHYLYALIGKLVTLHAFCFSHGSDTPTVE